MKNKVLYMVVILMVVLIAVGTVYTRPAAVTAADTEPQQQTWKGKYTIFQYTQHGWANRIYVTEFYIQDGVIYYKSREHQGEFLPVEFGNTLTVPEWIEDNSELVEYGYWTPVVD